MVTLQISEELDAELQQAADRLGCTKQDFLRDAVIARVEERCAAEVEFTEDQIARMRHSIAQLDRGEFITSELVDKKFEDWRMRRASL
jgi:predicted transcriptional regulator